MTDVTTPAATARIPFTPEAPVLIHLGGALGVKIGHVVLDEGGAKIDVRYDTAKGEKFRSVKWNTVTARVEDDPAVDAPAVDDVPVVDVADDVDALVVNMDGGEPGAEQQEAPAETSPVQVVAAAEDGTEVVVADTQHVDATEAPAPAADDAPAADQPRIVTLLSGQDKQKALAAAVFGTGDNGATWDGKSKITVTDADQAAAALDAALEADPTLKATVKAVRGKVTGQAPAPAAPKATDNGGPKNADLVRMAQDLVIQHGPTRILTAVDVDFGMLAGSGTWTNAAGETTKLDDEELLALAKAARHQAGRVLTLFKRPIPA